MLAAPSHSSKLHALTSRSLRRDPALANSTALASVRRAFSHLAAQPRAARKAQRMSLAERLSSRSDSSADGSPGSGTPGEMDLRRALETALGSLGALSAIYDQREARWRDEMRRLSEDRERVELLLAQALLKMGIKAGDRVGVMAGNCEQYAAIFFAVSRIGAILVILNNTYTPSEAMYAVQFSGRPHDDVAWFTSSQLGRMQDPLHHQANRQTRQPEILGPAGRRTASRQVSVPQCGRETDQVNRLFQ